MHTFPYYNPELTVPASHSPTNLSTSQLTPLLCPFPLPLLFVSPALILNALSAVGLLFGLAGGTTVFTSLVALTWKLHAVRLGACSPAAELGAGSLWSGRCTGSKTLW